MPMEMREQNFYIINVMMQKAMLFASLHFVIYWLVILLVNLMAYSAPFSPLRLKLVPLNAADNLSISLLTVWSTMRA